MRPDRPRAVRPRSQGTPSPRGAHALGWALALVLFGCGGEDPGAEGAAPGSAPKVRRSAERTDHPDLVSLRAWLDSSEAPNSAVIEAALRGARGADEFEADLLAARWASLQGEHTRSSQLLEKARERRPKDARVYATAAELHAAAGRNETADGEIARGVQTCGVTPELERAKGVALICRAGGVELGLEVLERARKNDPELPFLKRPLAQAYLLTGTKRLGDQRLEEAYAYALRAIELDPADPEQARFLVECQGALGLYEDCLRGYRDLIARGLPLQSELALMCKRAGMSALFEGDREKAMDHLLAARAAGLTAEELGSGQTILENAAKERIAEAEQAFEGGDYDRVEDLATRALQLDPEQGQAPQLLARCAVQRGMDDLQAGRFAEAVGQFESARSQDDDSLEAHHFLGHALYRLERYEEAAEAWQWVLDTSHVEDLELPEPVAVLLAKAQVLAGRPEDARQTLQAELSLRGSGPDAEEMRAILNVLDESRNK